MKYIIAIVVIYFIYRFFALRQQQLNTDDKEELEIGEYIDYEEVEQEEDQSS